MKRNLIIIVGVSFGLIILIISGNIIVVGEKIASLTHLRWTEWAFYGAIVGILCYYILFPIWRIHRAPAFPVLNISEQANEKQLHDLGRRLLKHCDYIEDDRLRKKHEEELGNDLRKASGDRLQLLNIVQEELTRRYDGNKEQCILGINGQIKEWAKSVFIISAISQNSKLDTISVMWLNYKMIEKIVMASGFRPNNRQMFKIYWKVLTTALVTYVMSEALENVGDVDLIHDDAFDDGAINNGESFLSSILHRIKIPGIIAGSAVDGSVNALMTLRIGFITRTYLQQGEKAFNGHESKQEIKLQAIKDSLNLFPIIALSAGKEIATGFSNLVYKHH